MEDQSRISAFLTLVHKVTILAHKTILSEDGKKGTLLVLSGPEQFIRIDILGPFCNQHRNRF